LPRKLWRKLAEQCITILTFFRRPFHPILGLELSLGEKLKSIAGQNIAASQEYVRKLSQARDLRDAIQVQTEFIRTQMSLFADQVKDLGELYFKAAASVMKTSFKSFS
jgi:hypothetical protein